MVSPTKGVVQSEIRTGVEKGTGAGSSTCAAFARGTVGMWVMSAMWVMRGV